ncbi:glycosidase [Actinomyces wuliandei]|uniref:glycosidase n=1 Tax=Actinomyces wuliandei TaxID=2057743 RepID=UPI000FDA327A|nr:glycosidase [Actinomyces wuliandei]
MTTTTTLIHRPYDGPRQWWRQALVYELASPGLGAADLERTGPLLDHVASLGLDTVLVRPSLVDTDTEADAVADFTGHAHQRGIRVLARVSGALGPVTGPHTQHDTRIVTGRETEGEDLLRRAEAFLAAGADGIDLGMIAPPEVRQDTDLEVLSAYFTLLRRTVTRYVSEGVIGADVSTDYPDSLRHHLQEDWVHHLRDDYLALARWDASSLTSHLSRSLNEHDQFQAPPTWRHLPSHAVLAEMAPGDGRRWYSASREERLRRANALQTMMLALPGSIYLRQGDEIALADQDKPGSPLELADLVSRQAQQQASQFGSPVATVRHAAHLRRENDLAGAPLAFVSGLEWCPQQALTFLVRGLLVLVNTSSAPVVLPQEARVLLASSPLSQDEANLLVPTATTTWIEASTVA